MKSYKTGYEKKALKALYELSRSITGVTDIEDVFDKILSVAVRLVGVEKASIMRYDPVDSTLKIIAAKGLTKKIMETVRVKTGEGISGRVFATAKPILIKDTKGAPLASRRKKYKSRSLISAPVTALPLKFRGRAIGVVNMTDKKDGTPFRPTDLELLTTIAAQAAAYLHIYGLAEKLQEAEGLRKEVELARGIQRALLPGRVPKLNGVTVAGRCIMATRIGGDYYDFLSSGWAPPAFIIADVSGHDVGAALLMAAFRSALRAEVGIPVLPPSAVVRRMNRLMFADLAKADQFISMAYLQYIYSSRTVRFTSAGHHPAWYYRSKRGSFEPLATDDPLLGIERGEHFHEKRFTVAKGDLVVMYTDGVPEALGPTGRRYGMSRLKKCIASHAKKTPAVIVDNICKDVERFAGSVPIKDDVTVMVLKFK